MTASRRVLWDAEETAILVHAYIQVKSELLFEDEAIKFVSNTLRERALRKGMDIGATFRNENGITMQMTKIEDLFSGGKFRLSPPPQVFVDVVNLYKKNRPAFNDLLQQAIGGSPLASSLEEAFFQWLAEKVPAALQLRLKNASHDLDRFFTTYKTLKTPLFDRDTIHAIDTVKSAITSNDILRFIHKDKLSLMQTLIEFYCIYLNEYQSIDSTQKSLATPHNIAADINLTTTNIVDFTSVKRGLYAYAQPTYLLYFNEKTEVNKWSVLYTHIARLLYRDHPEVIRWLSETTSDIAYTSERHKMFAPKTFADDLYIETKLSASDTVRKIKHLLDLCNIDYKNVTIVYTVLDKTSPLPEKAPVMLPDLVETDNTPPPTPSEDASDPIVPEEIVVQPSLSLGAYAFATDTPAAYTQTSRSVLSSYPISLIDMDALPHAYSESQSLQEEYFL